MLTIDPRYTWGTWVAGEWDVKGSLATELTGKNYNYPSMSKQYRMSTQKRVYFGPWEGYFLLAEAGVRVGMFRVSQIELRERSDCELRVPRLVE